MENSIHIQVINSGVVTE